MLLIFARSRMAKDLANQIQSGERPETADHTDDAGSFAAAIFHIVAGEHSEMNRSDICGSRIGAAALKPGDQQGAGSVAEDVD